MSRLDSFGEILDSYDEKFLHSWKAFLAGFEEKYITILNQFDDQTKQKLVNGYSTVIEISVKTKKQGPVAVYYDGIKKHIDSTDLAHNQAALRAYAESLEEFVRSMEP